LKVQQAISQVTATADYVNIVGNATSRLVSNVSQAMTEWDTWFDRADDAHRTISEMTSQAEMTSSSAREMLDILADFDQRAEGWRSICSWL